MDAKLMAIGLKALACLSVVIQAVLFAAVFDIFHLGLNEIVAPLAYAPILLLAVAGCVPVFLGGRGSASHEPAAAIASIEEAQRGLAGRLGTMQTALDGFQSQLSGFQAALDAIAGADRKSLVDENAGLREQVEKLAKASEEQLVADAEALRAKNRELEEQIRLWAIKTVGSAIESQEPISRAS